MDYYFFMKEWNGFSRKTIYRLSLSRNWWAWGIALLVHRLTPERCQISIQLLCLTIDLDFWKVKTKGLCTSDVNNG